MQERRADSDAKRVRRGVVVVQPARGADDDGASTPTRVMLSVAEASDILGVSDDLVYELARPR